MTTFIIDGSSWCCDKHPTQEIYTLRTNPQQLIDTGCIGAIVRLNSGAWVDPGAVQFLEQLGGILPMAGYYYDRHTLPFQQSAETFIQQVQRFGGLETFKLGLWCDAPEVESAGTAVIDHALKSIEMVAAELKPDMKKSGIYTNKNFWYSNGGEYQQFESRALKFQLWCALWNNLPGVVPEVYRPRPWTRWIFHQYSADNNRMARHIGILTGDPDADLNLFNPLLGRFESYFGVVKPPVSDDPSDPELAAKVAALELRLSGLEAWAEELAYQPEVTPL